MQDKLYSCIIAGAIGDALGTKYEGLENPTFDPDEMLNDWQLSDDTQLTIATIEAIIIKGSPEAESIAKQMAQWYRERRITGIGSSTLKALIEIDTGSHWTQSGRQGEYAAGNGAAMRIAPLAFYLDTSEDPFKLGEISRITHKNDEAFVGSLAIYTAIRLAITDKLLSIDNLILQVSDELYDSQVKDRCVEISKETISISEMADKYGSSAYVVESVPLALYAVQKMYNSGLESIFEELIKCGGDTDTNCSLAGQIYGAICGSESLPKALVSNLKNLPEYKHIEECLEKAPSILC